MLILKTLWTLVLIAIIAISTPFTLADDPRGAPEPPWKVLERELIKQNIKTDTLTLIHIARLHPDNNVRWLAIEILGLRGERQAIDVLLLILTNENDQLLKETAALALARLKDERGKQALRTFMSTSGVPERQIFLATRLAELDDESGYTVVVNAVTSRNPQLRYLSVAGLVAFVPLQLKTEAAEINPVDHLIALTEDSEPQVRKEVLIQMPIAVNKGVPIKLFKSSVEKVVNDDSSQTVRETARSMLSLWLEMCRQTPKAKQCQ